MTNGGRGESIASLEETSVVEDDVEERRNGCGGNCDSVAEVVGVATASVAMGVAFGVGVSGSPASFVFFLHFEILNMNVGLSEAELCIDGTLFSCLELPACKVAVIPWVTLCSGDVLVGAAASSGGSGRGMVDKLRLAIGGSRFWRKEGKGGVLAGAGAEDSTVKKEDDCVRGEEFSLEGVLIEVEKLGKKLALDEELELELAPAFDDALFDLL